MTTKTTYKIDAANRSLGRVASEAAVALRGKTAPDFTRHLVPGQRVEIVNAGQLKVSALKMRTKTYARYSGYPGGLREPSLAQIVEKHGLAGALRLAIQGMLPRNKLRAKILKQLEIKE